MLTVQSLLIDWLENLVAMKTCSNAVVKILDKVQVVKHTKFVLCGLAYIGFTRTLKNFVSTARLGRGGSASILSYKCLVANVLMGDLSLLNVMFVYVSALCTRSTAYYAIWTWRHLLSKDHPWRGDLRTRMTICVLYMLVCDSAYLIVSRKRGFEESTQNLVSSGVEGVVSSWSTYRLTAIL